MKATKFSQYLQNREELKFVDRPHWIYILEDVLWSLVIIAFGLISHSFIASHIIFPELSNNLRADGFFINIAAWVATVTLWGSFVVAILYFLNRLVFWASTYIFASDRRLFMKTGLIRVLVNEVSFEEIRKTDINYGLFGRFLGYGKLMMDARFVEDSELPYSYHPEKFIKLIHYANDLAGDINISYVTNNMEEEADNILSKSSDVSDQVKPQREHEKFANYAFSDGAPISSSGIDTSDKELDKPAQSSVKKADI